MEKLTEQLLEVLHREPVAEILNEVVRGFIAQTKATQIQAQINKLKVLADGWDVETQRKAITELVAELAQTTAATKGA